jgi:hypothetical protein
VTDAVASRPDPVVSESATIVAKTATPPAITPTRLTARRRARVRAIAARRSRAESFFGFSVTVFPS